MQERNSIFRGAELRNLGGKSRIRRNQFPVRRKGGGQLDAIVNRLGDIERHHECLMQQRKRWNDIYS